MKRPLNPTLPRPDGTYELGGRPVVYDPGLPTVDQLLNLADRAEHKGGLTPDEAARFREGIRHFGVAQDRADYYKELSEQHRGNARQRERRRVQQGSAGGSTADDSRLIRLAEMAHRWLSIPQRRQAGSAVLAIVNDVPGQAHRSA